MYENTKFVKDNDLYLFVNFTKLKCGGFIFFLQSTLYTKC